MWLCAVLLAGTCYAVLQRTYLYREYRSSEPLYLPQRNSGGTSKSSETAPRTVCNQAWTSTSTAGAVSTTTMAACRPGGSGAGKSKWAVVPSASTVMVVSSGVTFESSLRTPYRSFRSTLALVYRHRHSVTRPAGKTELPEGAPGASRPCFLGWHQQYRPSSDVLPLPAMPHSSPKMHGGRRVTISRLPAHGVAISSHHHQHSL